MATFGEVDDDALLTLLEATAVPPQSVEPKPKQDTNDLKSHSAVLPKDVSATAFVKDHTSLGSAANTSLGELPLRDWDKAEGFVETFAAHFGIPVTGTFRCILPGHTAEAGSACLWCDERGIYVYRDLHEVQQRGSYALAQ